MLPCSQLRGFGAEIVGIDTDANGMNAEHLNQVLSNWSRPGGLPKVLYTIPNGSNPTGASMDLQRKKDIYSVRMEPYPASQSVAVCLDCSKV